MSPASGIFRASINQMSPQVTAVILPRLGGYVTSNGPPSPGLVSPLTPTERTQLRELLLKLAIASERLLPG